ncbi:MAG TPA: PAS domain S-box protein, partial [Rubricoccaceae bacterium]
MSDSHPDGPDPLAPGVPDPASQTRLLRYRRLADAVPQLVWTTDDDGRPRYYNDRWLAYTGQSAEEALAPGGAASVVHPDDIEASRARWEAVRDGGAFEAEYRLRRHDGVYEWHLARAVRVAGEDGGAEWVGSATNVQALRESEAKLRLLVESATDYAILTTDPYRRVTSWNAGAQALFGYTEDEVLGEPVDLLFTPEDRAAGVPEKEAEQALGEGRAPDDRWHLRKDGTRFFVTGVMMPLHDGSLQGFVKIARDLTAQREAEAALAEREDRYRTLFTTIDEGFALCEVVVGHDGEPVDYRFLEVNPAFAEMTGLPHELAGRTARELIPGLEDVWVERYARVATERESARFEDHAGGLGRWFDVF